ncbi:MULTISPECIES: DUF1707 SHOCT-like domain-containing protein [Dietzia]|uniref:DUF1707 domain-containing protein n=2 Tax=Dietzia cinnamea TaxID=321318 RepID=A0AAW5QB75_9ACTN|nr:MULTISPECIES: DUF1707 domain-containing protein [Dietzia]KZO58148.1 hypothetical protein A2U19_12490 [Dietzia maris]MCT1640038.1 DUF1707 domain-containing protein [Dietzia cinnamea]MCT1862887.1 DUF1707 domain-containing protein [Dietzia cinnamea]MCT1884790.1 DUF1707 domain-containing protein [Dietzia cinnamea]MCT2028750.1 DUF1707 domain-containing protein [Dietzia cinnamea]
MDPEQDNDPRALAQRRLEAMVGRGELSLAEFSDRAAQIWAATCPAELEVALSGLPAGSDPAAPPAAHRPGPPAPRPGAAIVVDEGQKTTSIFDTLKREGRWMLPDDYRLTSWMGEIYLDAREAVVDRPRTHLQLDLWAANARVLLPPGVSVTITGNRTMTDLKIDEGRYEVHGGPHLDIEINGFMANAKIKILAAGEKIPKTWKWF